MRERHCFTGKKWGVVYTSTQYCMLTHLTVLFLESGHHPASCESGMLPHLPVPLLESGHNQGQRQGGAWGAQAPPLRCRIYA